jgi:hypothetical protein
MPRGPHRRWKGCAMCKSHKHAGHGDAVRMPWAAVKRFGNRRRLSRKDVSAPE